MKKRSKTETESSLKKLLWQDFSKYIRLRDADKYGFIVCITCGKVVKWKEAHAGHGIGGRYNYILFDEELVNGQCFNCNSPIARGGKGGNYGKYAVVLIKRHGMKWYEKKLKYKVRQFTKQELKDLRIYYREKWQKELLKIKDEF